jgi:predicted Zn-dependent peptidase
MIDQKYSKVVLKNGLRLILVPEEGKNVLTAMILYGTGSRNEVAAEAGISHVLEHMHYKGTQKRPSSLAISEFVENIGGEHNAFTGKEYTGYYVKAASKHLEKCLDFLSDLLGSPLLLAKELEQEKNVIIQEVDMYKDLPSDVVSTSYEEAIFGNNALGREIIGTKKSIKSITREDLLLYRKKHYIAENAVLALVGNLKGHTFAQLEALVEKYFIFETPIETEMPKIKLSLKKCIKITKKKTEQSHLIVGFVGVPRSHPDRYPLRLLALILGGSMSSRMFSEIREKRGLAYSVSTSTSDYQESGSIDTHAGVPNERVLEAVEAILNEYRKIKVNINETELARAKEIISGRMLISMEDTNETANFFASSELELKQIRTLDQVFEIYSKITVEDLLDIANKYFVDEKMVLSYVGKKIDEVELNKIFKL